MTKTFIMGNLTGNPDFKTTQSGNGICNISVACSRKFTSNGQQQEEVSFIDVVVYGRQAENCRQYLEKGSKVLVEGHLKQERFEDREGKKRSKLFVVAETVTFLNTASRYEQQDNNSGYSGRPEYDQPPSRY